jgi:hypothetical protein
MPKRIFAVFAAAVLFAGASAITGSADQKSDNSAPGGRLSPQEAAQKLLRSHASEFMTSSALTALKIIASGDNSFPHHSDIHVPTTSKGPQGGRGPKESTFKNARVNDPQEDTNPSFSINQLDQTTQSETSIAVRGNNLVTGFNDSFTTPLFLTAGSDLSGYAYSTNGGQSWVDGGSIPNKDGDMNFGDPWLVSDSAGNFYYSTLYLELFPQRFALDVGVAKSTDGGKTFGRPVPVDTPFGQASPFYEADKDALASGPGVGGSGQALYDSWDDFVFQFEPCCNFFSGLPVSHSYDGGQTWTMVYADQIPLFGPGCSFQQFIGANPFVSPAGTVFDAVERLFVNNPDCNFNPEPPLQREERIYRSDDGGNTWSPARTVDAVTPSEPTGLFFLGPGKYMRNLEFPTTAMVGNSLFVAWNDGRSGKSHIQIARSDDGGVTWASTPAADGQVNDEIQPAMVGDASGLHILYYVRNPDLTLDTYVDNSPTGTAFTPVRVSNLSFPGVYTFPQFDPIIAFGYMGDYIGITTDGAHQYMAWGDNRDRTCDFLFPTCRNDPNVYSAVQ